MARLVLERRLYDWHVVDADERGSLYEYFGSTAADTGYDVLQELDRQIKARGHTLVRAEVTINGLKVAERRCTNEHYYTRIKPEPNPFSPAPTEVKHLPVQSKRAETNVPAKPAAKAAATSKDPEPPCEGLRLVSTRRELPKMLVRDQYKLVKEG